MYSIEPPDIIARYGWAVVNPDEGRAPQVERYGCLRVEPDRWVPLPGSDGRQRGQRATLTPTPAVDPPFRRDANHGDA